MNNIQGEKVFGKCCYTESSERCGCQRFTALSNDERTCEACYHHSSYHEDIENKISNPNINKQRISTLDELYSSYNTNSNVSSLNNQEASTSSLLNQLLTGRALEEQSIASELSRTFTQRTQSLKCIP